MAKPQWYEKKSWTAEDEEEFRKRLKRCRGDYSQKQKLLTQAGILAGPGTKQAILDSEKVLDLFDELFPDDQGAAYESIVHQRAPLGGQPKNADLSRFHSRILFGSFLGRIASNRLRH